MQQGFTVFLLIVFAFVCFVVYFVFKQIQFFIQATNLYKKMIERQDIIIKLLNEIKEKTCTTGQTETKNEPNISTEKKQKKMPDANMDTLPSIPDDEVVSVCPHCNEKYRDNLTDTDCPSCGGYIFNE